MLIQANPEEADAILGAMRQVATENDRQPLSETGASALKAVARYVFRLNEDLRISALPSVTPADLAAILTTQDQRAAACRFLAVTPLLDSRLDAAKIEVFLGTRMRSQSVKTMSGNLPNPSVILIGSCKT
jgi:hypothetical protein